MCLGLASRHDGFDRACSLAGVEQASQDRVVITGSGGRDRRVGIYARRPDAIPAQPALSPRELDVLRLLADGASNPAISKVLYISRRTTEHHVEHILTKLGVTSRSAAVAYALTHELLS